MTETGHAKNVANFQRFTSTCQDIENYNPTNPEITITTFLQRQQEFQQHLDNVSALRPGYILAVNERQAAFALLKPLCTRILGALQASGTNKLTIQNALTIVRKIRGARLGKPKQNPETAGQNTKNISNSQRSCDFLMDHFANLIALLEACEEYAPGIPDLEITALKDLLHALRQANQKVGTTQLTLHNAFTARDQALYHNADALLQIIKTAKQYVISLHGTKSPQYKLLTSLQFKKITN